MIYSADLDGTGGMLLVEDIVSDELGAIASNLHSTCGALWVKRTTGAVLVLHNLRADTGL
jgi:hypothetical protein